MIDYYSIYTVLRERIKFYSIIFLALLPILFLTSIIGVIILLVWGIIASIIVTVFTFVFLTLRIKD